jgi:hypothetical protein
MLGISNDAAQLFFWALLMGFFVYFFVSIISRMIVGRNRSRKEMKL